MLYVNKSIDHFYYCFGMCSIIQLLLMFNEPHSQATFCSVYCLGDYQYSEESECSCGVQCTLLQQRCVAERTAGASHIRRPETEGLSNYVQ